MYFIGSEECERSIAQSAVNTSKKNWELYLAEALGPQYVPLRAHTLQAIHLIVFVHKDIIHLCSDITSAAVATGLGNTMGNKGGVGIQIKIGETKLLVVNAHLAAHQNAIKQRNSDYSKIDKGLPIQLLKKTAMLEMTDKQHIHITNDTIKPSEVHHHSIHQSSSTASGSTHSIAEYADRVIFMGDLNYRIRGNRSAISKLIEMNMHEVMISNDQLK